MRVVAVIPALNEEDSIGKVVLESSRYVDELIVVDDGSSDNTATIAQEAGALVVSHPVNLGVGRAFSTGVVKALERGAEIVVTLDADGQFIPDEIPLLLKPIIEGRADFVTGSRFMRPELVPEMSPTKIFGNKLFTQIVGWLTGMNLTDTQCGFRAYSKEALLRLTLFGRFTYTQEVFLDLVSKNMRVVEIPVRILPRSNGKSRIVRNPVHYGLRAMKIIVQTERDSHPLRFFTAISLLFLVPGITMFFLVLANWLVTGMTTPFTSLITLAGTLSLVGVIFIVLALLADMQGRQRRLQEEMLYLLRRQRYS